MLFKLDKNDQKYFDVQKLYGNSYSYVGLNIDGPNEEINMKIKQMQAKEFAEVAEMRLFHQKQHFRHKLMMERRKKTGEEYGKPIRIEHVHPDISLQEEFKDFTIADFMPLNYTEKELVDLVISNKLDEVEKDVNKQERCCAWVLTHCK